MEEVRGVAPRPPTASEVHANDRLVDELVAVTSYLGVALVDVILARCRWDPMTISAPAATLRMSAPGSPAMASPLPALTSANATEPTETTSSAGAKGLVASATATPGPPITTPRLPAFAALAEDPPSITPASLAREEMACNACGKREAKGRRSCANAVAAKPLSFPWERTYEDGALQFVTKSCLVVCVVYSAAVLSRIWQVTSCDRRCNARAVFSSRRPIYQHPAQARRRPMETGPGEMFTGGETMTRHRSLRGSAKATVPRLRIRRRHRTPSTLRGLRGRSFISRVSTTTTVCEASTLCAPLSNVDVRDAKAYVGPSTFLSVTRPLSSTSTAAMRRPARLTTVLAPESRFPALLPRERHKRVKFAKRSSTQAWCRFLPWIGGEP
ncbi:hypothetical protein BDK51DRAFT_39722 [Blyttiomyces helicus]|uniref:Uncharacterized protein n=1 Tax=Blyttiomyces helicus TaxID=388810 RepID=A0A4P9W6X4_9FUNG|nr:hypothetical protein BDK51DRAFT_39722 [Blyttiomyces helicus]|eukprot:RKO87133.1 hypothetical protein BDK51DRAFT_39722 [Blyttiomyces helicus]